MRAISIDFRQLAGRILYLCIAAELGLALLDAIFPGVNVFDVDLPLQRIFNLAREGSVPSWFGITQTMFIGMTAWAIGWVLRHDGAPVGLVRRWFVLGWIFVYLAVDDAALIHERMGTLFKNSTGGKEGWTSFWPSFTWQLVVGPVFLLFGLYVLFFLWKQLGPTRGHLFVIGGLTCFAVAIGLDFVEGYDEIIDRLTDFLDWESYSVGHGLRVIEETLEMFGMTLIWYALLRHLGQVSDKLRLEFKY